MAGKFERKGEDASASSTDSSLGRSSTSATPAVRTTGAWAQLSVPVAVVSRTMRTRTGWVAVSHDHEGCSHQWLALR